MGRVGCLRARLDRPPELPGRMAFRRTEYDAAFRSYLDGLIAVAQKPATRPAHRRLWSAMGEDVRIYLWRIPGDWRAIGGTLGRFCPVVPAQPI